MIIKNIHLHDMSAWDSYARIHPDATLYHLSGWKSVIEKTYGHNTHYLMAQKIASNQNSSTPPTNQSDSVVGILPLTHFKHFVFGNNLVSIPYFDMGGILADDAEIERALLSEAMKLGTKLKVNNIELRHAKPLSCLSDNVKQGPMSCDLSAMTLSTRSHKVRMLRDLPNSSEELLKSYKSKLRSQIKKPIKEGLKATVGRLELLDDFYKVFLVNMRDLGSPVHSHRMMKNVLEQFPETSKIVVVYKDETPVACSMIVGFKDTLENPWASSLRQYSRLSPNMLLYWTMLEYACENGYKWFDFGRSSPDEGTYKFKKQWGAKPNQLHWHYITLQGQPVDEETTEKSKFDKAIQYWQKLPVPVTKIIGPWIRKHISL